MDTLVNLQFLVDDAKCFDTVRRLRWPEGVRCAQCGGGRPNRAESYGSVFPALSWCRFPSGGGALKGQVQEPAR
jgi:hypothetical protein